MHTRQSTFWSRVTAALVLLAVLGARAALAADPVTDVDPELYQKTVQKAIDFLTTSQAADGSFSASGVGPGITAVVLSGVMRTGRGPDDPLVAKGLKYLLSHTQPDGGIYDKSARQKNYEACLALVCLKDANIDGRYDKQIKDCDKYLKNLQFPEGDKRTPADLSYGGMSYAGPERPDLSNTQALMDAFQAAGNGSDDEAVKRALVFISRCQNLETENNTTQYASKTNDGGFYYAPRSGGGAGPTENGGLKSYGSMSYAGLKSMIYAGLTPEDPRVKAATSWITSNYTVSENPGTGLSGLFYYYSIFGKALDALGQDKLVDSKGVAHDWRKDLVEQLSKIQKSNGSWSNSNTSFMEGDPNLATGFSLLALSYCKPAKK